MKSLLLILVLWGAGASAQIRQPNVSANALMLYRNSNFAKEDTSTERNGLDLREAEVAFYADVDPYSRFNLLLAVHPEYELDAATNRVTQSWAIEPEELFADLTSLPWTTLRLGKFKAAMGKHNTLHTHAYPFIDAPLANTVLLGDEGLNDVGVSAAVLFPAPWFSEFTIQYLRGEGENAEFNSPTPGDGVGLAHWKNLWDLSESLTFELGASYAKGGNDLAAETDLAGADVTFKWRPTEGGKYISLILASEYLGRNRTDGPTGDKEKAQGWNAWTQFQFAERWAVVARAEGTTVRNETGNAVFLGDESLTRTTAGFVFNATEFSSYRLEYSETNGFAANANGDTKEQKLLIQANFTIGAHPAHSY